MIYTCKYCKNKNVVSNRSSQQNRYLHLVLSIIGDYLGYTMDEIKTLMKYHFKYYRELTNKNTGETVIVYDETSKMNSKECSDFTQKLIQFAAEHGIDIKSPQEYFET